MINTQDDIVSKFQGGASDLIHSSFRYYLGRMTIAACQFAEDLARAWPLLGPSLARMIKNELEKAFEEDDIARKENSKYLPLGHDCDRRAWEKVRAAYQTSGT
jgi:hypothetical protein